MTDWLLDIDARVIDAIKIAKERGFCSAGDAVIVVTGWVNDLSLMNFFNSSFLATGLWYNKYVANYLCRLNI
jgi:hypothetical protein